MFNVGCMERCLLKVFFDSFTSFFIVSLLFRGWGSYMYNRASLYWCGCAIVVYLLIYGGRLLCGHRYVSELHCSIVNGRFRLQTYAQLPENQLC